VDRRDKPGDDDEENTGARRSRNAPEPNTVMAVLVTAIHVFIDECAAGRAPSSTSS
jgi:hypothetical protein